MHFVNLLLSSLLALGVSAVPAPVPAAANTDTSVEVFADMVDSWNDWQIQVNGSDATVAELHQVIADNAHQAEDARQAGKRCSWHDGFGPVDCSAFSFTFGEQGGFHNRDVLVIYGNGWKVQKYGQFDCGNLATSGDWWKSFASPLPWTLDIHPGNTCFALASKGQYWDNTWIKYSAQFVNLPTDGRCGNIFGSYGRRCILPI